MKELILFLYVAAAVALIVTITPRRVKVKYLAEDGNTVMKIKEGDWIDLRSAEDVCMQAGEFKLIRLGVAMKLPHGYEAHIVPRSSTFMKYHVLQTNSMGVIDNAYSGDLDEWKFPAYATEDTHIPAGDRICQFRIVRKQPELKFKTVKMLGGKSRGGFGSTGRQ